MTASGEWILAVDFGTTNTVAAVSGERGAETLVVDGRPVMPSAVFLNPDRRTWSCGETAGRLARRRLEWFEPNPKNCVAAGTIFLGGRDVPVGQAITAILRPICEEAVQQHGGRVPAAYVVTHPADWGEARVNILLQAAAAGAGRHWPAPWPLPEPVAAAQGILGIDGAPRQARFVVLDLGGGTVDVSVVDRDGDMLTVVGQPTGQSGMGGEDYDRRLAQWMVEEAGVPGLYDRLASSSDIDERERAVEIRTHAREVKEELSRAPAVPALLPKSPPELPEPTPVMVSRSQLEELICGGPDHEPGLAEAVDLVTGALDQAPPGPAFAGVFLTGGSARIPMLGRLVQERTGQRPLSYGEPSTAVARGAAEHGRKLLAAARGQEQRDQEERDRQLQQQKRRRRPRLSILVAAIIAVLGGGVIAAVAVMGHTCSNAGCVVPRGPSSSPTNPSPTNPSPTDPSPTNPSPTDPSPTNPSPAGLTSAEQGLVNELNSSALDNCTGRSDLEDGDVVAAVNCQAVNSGPRLI